MKPKKLRVGDQVTLKRGTRLVKATIIEDRGNIGVRGRQIVRIRIEAKTAEEADVFEIPAEDVAAA